MIPVMDKKEQRSVKHNNRDLHFLKLYKGQQAHPNRILKMFTIVKMILLLSSQYSSQFLLYSISRLKGTPLSTNHLRQSFGLSIIFDTVHLCGICKDNAQK